MRCKHWMLVLAFAAAGLVGCKGSSGPGEDPAQANVEAQPAAAQSQPDQQTAAWQSGQTVPSDTSQPAAAVSVFLDALRRGDDDKVMEMYTVRARQEAAQTDEHFVPRGSDTAQFQVGGVEYLAEHGARVACTWTDLDQAGQQHTLELLWMVRREPQGWRVAGMAAFPFPGEPPVLLDFENLDKTKREMNLLAEEIARRAETGSREAHHPENSRDPLRR